MKQLIILLATGAILGIANEGAEAGEGQLLVPMPDGFKPEETDEWRYDGVEVTNNTPAALDRARAERKAQIKREAAVLIEATDWRLERAKEREIFGWGTLTNIDIICTERENIRRSSNAAEAAVDALASVAAVRSFTWSVTSHVPVPQRLTHAQLMARFTQAELENILVARKVHTSVDAFWEMFDKAQDVNLLDPRVQLGFSALEMGNLIGKGRAKVLLTPPEPAFPQ